MFEYVYMKQCSVFRKSNDPIPMKTITLEYSNVYNATNILYKLKAHNFFTYICE